ncbi:hypothetical protein PUN4_590006 [Paraburkholderia unamae]|nr:hypothetical protein PUN4_590006 [Paraburkholderia unamae]
MKGENVTHEDMSNFSAPRLGLARYSREAAGPRTIDIKSNNIPLVPDTAGYFAPVTTLSGM